MSVFDRAREKSRIISFIVKLQNTALYPAVFAVICAVSGVFGKEIYLPCLAVATLLSVFVGLFSPDLKVFLVPAFMLYYAVGMDMPDTNFEHYYGTPTFDKSSVPYFVFMLGLIVIVLLYRLISGGYIKETLSKRGIFFWGIICLDAVLIFGGLFSPSYTIESFLFGLMLAAVLTLFYLLSLVIFSHSEDGIAYACKTLVFTGFLVMAQIIYIALRLNQYGNLFWKSGGEMVLNRDMLSLTWGPATIIGGVLIPPVAAAVYLMRTRKYPVLSLLSAIFFICGTLLINTRSAMFMGAAILFFGLCLCCMGGRNKKANRISASVLVLLCIAVIVVFVIKFPDTYKAVWDKIADVLRLDASGGVSDFLSDRPAIWLKGLRDFLAYPVFGTGFMYGYFEPGEQFVNLFSNMYHNVIVQFLGSMGIVGILMFLFHLKHLAEVMLRRFSVEKLLLLLVPFSILGMSLADNFFFYPNFIIVYTAFIAASEILLEKAREKRLLNLKAPRKNGKPRVVFTFVEAGKGHIIPTQNVCDSFRSKYGDRVEVVESRFFTETGDERLEMTEKLFSRAVKQQNRSGIWSVLCKIGNVLAGDTLALFGVLRMSISGRKANPLAVKHIEELDADVIYTAHWSIPFYVNQLNTPRPYTVCFCPDIYSNGAFNVDCNRFLIPSDVGYKQICRHRMYAGGNVMLVPFPMRPEAENYKADGVRAACREKLGIPEDAFVAVLCDGGYGMAHLESTVRALLKLQDVPRLTIIAMCGTNKKLYEKLTSLKDSYNGAIRLIPVDFTDKPLEYLVCADVFAGKSGANSIAEPASLGIPIIVTHCATYIERGIKNYYVHQIKGAVYVPSAKRAAAKIARFARNPELLLPYANNLKNSPRLHYSADASADILFESLKNIYPDI